MNIRILLSNAVFSIRQYIRYLPDLFGIPIEWDKINYAIFKRNHVKYGNLSYAFGKIYVKNRGTIQIGNNFQINSGQNFNPIGGDTILRLITYTSKASIVIGNNVGISNSTISCYDKIIIENGVMIGGSVRIWDTNFHSLDPIIRTSGNDTDIRTAEVRICEYAFIGAGSIIMKGVTIGRNSIIAAGSVVVKSIPDNVIAGGNPCVFIKYI